MKHIKIYEQFAGEVLPAEQSVANYEVETEDIKPTDGSTEGNYFILFPNAEGENTTIEIGGAVEPEFVGNSMVSAIEMVPDSSSDGRNYMVTGYYDKLPEPGNAYELKKVLVKEA